MLKIGRIVEAQHMIRSTVFPIIIGIDFFESLFLSLQGERKMK
jgi:hypothetical protein